jgi:hypothetical protein
MLLRGLCDVFTKIAGFSLVMPRTNLKAVPALKLESVFAGSDDPTAGRCLTLIRDDSHVCVSKFCCIGL